MTGQRLRGRMRKRAAGGAGIEKSAAGVIECGPPYGTGRPHEQGALARPDQLIAAVAAVHALGLGAPIALPEGGDGLIRKPSPAAAGCGASTNSPSRSSGRPARAAGASAKASAATCASLQKRSSRATPQSARSCAEIEGNLCRTAAGAYRPAAALAHAGLPPHETIPRRQAAGSPGNWPAGHRCSP